MKNMIKGMIVCFSMYSVFPMPEIRWEKPSVKYVFCFLPLVGAFIGAAEALWFVFSSRFALGAPLYGAVAAALPFAVTGGIHMDGYIDVWDALSSHEGEEKMRRILKDPHVGAFGVLHTAVYCMLLFGVFCEFYSRGGSLLFLFLLFPLSRALGGLAPVTVPSSSKSGLLYLFSGRSDKKSVIVILSVYIIIIFAVLLLYEGTAAFLAAVSICAAGYVLFRRLCIVKFGGISGDLAGFFIQALELPLIAAAAFAGGWL